MTRHTQKFSPTYTDTASHLINNELMKSPSLKLFFIPLSLHMVKRSEESVCLLQPRQLTAFSYRTVGTCRSDKSCTGTDPHVKTARCKRWKWNKLVWIITDNHGLFFFQKWNFLWQLLSNINFINLRYEKWKVPFTWSYFRHRSD